MFTVCSVIYGDYEPLARKLLESLKDNRHVRDIRLGLNATGVATREYVHSWAADQFFRHPVYIYQPRANANVGKYPLMRQMFYHGNLADRIMWFDDDSYLDPSAGPNWWDRANNVSSNQWQVGAIHSIMQRGKQYEVIERQPWYTRKPVNSRHRFKFITGGWWIANSAFIKRWDYPWADLYHNGGDSMLGELLRQRKRPLASFPGGQQCHCESCDKRNNKFGGPVVHINVGGRKGRRGIGVKNERYVWSDGNPNPSLNHQNFELEVYCYEV